MRIYNSATHKKEEFQPIESGKVRMYVCGPTVYDNIHIGNARTFISFDVIRRWLIASGYEVTFAQNLTDVDDKIIKRANEQGRTAAEVATEFSDKFIGVMRAANVLDPDVRPRATKEIGPMIAMIKTLIEQGHAYAADNGDVYFAVRSDPNYGQVSGRNIDDLMVGARIEENEDKNDPLDFALWKAAKPGEPSWPSPWGEGRPGWHTECAAMVHRYLGTPIDIHGGGMDLMFPHHECEIAQSTAALGHDSARYWVHNNMITINGQKMGKSLGNFITLEELFTGRHKLLAQAYSPMTIRFFVLQAHYRSTLDFSNEALQAAEKGLDRLMKGIETLGRIKPSEKSTVDPAELEHRCAEAMADDLNSPMVISALFDWVRHINQLADGTQTITAADLETLRAIVHRYAFDILGLKDEKAAGTAAGRDYVTPLVEMLLAERLKARAAKDWAASDRIRDGLSAAGIRVKDRKDGSDWELE